MGKVRSADTAHRHQHRSADQRAKRGRGRDSITFGSPTLVQSLTNAGLVDEYRILIHPVIVNKGKRLFENLDGRTDFRLISVDTFERGAILVKYAPIEA